MKANTHYLGFDVGGTKIAIEGFDKNLKSVFKEQVKTEQNGGLKGFLKQLESLIEAHMHSKIKGIGMALPGIVTHEGILIHAPHLPIKKPLKIKQKLQKKWKVPVHVENDVNAFLMAEVSEKKFKKMKNTIAVMIGTGVGGAAMVNGQLMKGKNGFAGEFGHMIIRQDRVKNTFEKNASGFYQKKKQDIVEQVGIGLANLNVIFNPEAIVLGGSIYTHHLKKHKKKLEKIIASHSLDHKSPKLIDANAKTSVAKGAVLGLLEA